MLIGTPVQKTEYIKESVLSPEGKTLLYINISYPSLNGRDKFSRAANAFYRKNADAFYDFAKNNLAKKASPDSPQPMAAVYRSKVTYEDRKYLSVFCEASVYDGASQSASGRSSQLWSRKECNLLQWSDVFTKEAKNYFENADRRIFYATDKGFAIGTKDGEQKFFAFDELRAKGLLTSTLTIGQKTGIF